MKTHETLFWPLLPNSFHLRYLSPISPFPHCKENKDFFSKCDQIRSLQQIFSNLLWKPILENFDFCAVPHSWRLRLAYPYILIAVIYITRRNNRRQLIKTHHWSYFKLIPSLLGNKVWLHWLWRAQKLLQSTCNGRLKTLKHPENQTNFSFTISASEICNKTEIWKNKSFGLPANCFGKTLGRKKILINREKHAQIW